MENDQNCVVYSRPKNANARILFALDVTPCLTFIQRIVLRLTIIGNKNLQSIYSSFQMTVKISRLFYIGRIFWKKKLCLTVTKDVKTQKNIQFVFLRIFMISQLITHVLKVISTEEDKIWLFRSTLNKKVKFCKFHFWFSQKFLLLSGFTYCMEYFFGILIQFVLIQNLISFILVYHMIYFYQT